MSDNWILTRCCFSNFPCVVENVFLKTSWKTNLYVTSNFDVVRENVQDLKKNNVWCSGFQTNRPTFYFSSQKIYSQLQFYLSGPVNKFWNFCVPLSLLFTENSHYNFSQHFFHVGFVSILVFQTFNWTIFFVQQGGTWWQYETHKWYTIRKSL